MTKGLIHLNTTEESNGHNWVNMNGYTLKKDNAAIFISVSVLSWNQLKEKRYNQEQKFSLRVYLC